MMVVTIVSLTFLFARRFVNESFKICCIPIDIDSPIDRYMDVGRNPRTGGRLYIRMYVLVSIDTSQTTNGLHDTLFITDQLEAVRSVIGTAVTM